MARTAQFAVLQNDAAHPSEEQLKRVFRTFHNLTDADAVRLATGAQGILLRQANRDAARAFQSALKAEGIAASVVSEASLPALPTGISLHRLQFSPEALIIFDVLGRPQPIAWARVGLIAAAAVRHYELTKTRSGGDTLKAGPASRSWAKGLSAAAHKMESESQFVLEIVLAGGAARYQITAAEFPFPCFWRVRRTMNSVSLCRLHRCIKNGTTRNAPLKCICLRPASMDSEPERPGLPQPIGWIFFLRGSRARE